MFFFSPCSSAPAFMSYIGIDRPPVEQGSPDAPVLDQVRAETFKGTVRRDFQHFRFFSWIGFPQAPEWTLMLFSGAWGKMIYERNLSQKSRVTVPLNVQVIIIVEDIWWKNNIVWGNFVHSDPHRKLRDLESWFDQGEFSYILIFFDKSTPSRLRNFNPKWVRHLPTVPIILGNFVYADGRNLAYYNLHRKLIITCRMRIRISIPV